MAEITKEAVQGKLDKGEKLTPEETKFVMSLPPDGVEPAPENTDEDDPFKDIEDEGKEEEGKEKEEKGEEEGKEKETPEGDEDKEEAEPGKAAKEKPEEKKSEAKPGEAEPPKKEEEKKPDEETFHAKVERTLDLPDYKINLDGYSDREKGLFWELRKERKARQKAEEERDAERFDKIKKQKLEELKAKEKAEEEEEKPSEDDEEFITKGEAKKREKARKEAEALDRAAQARAVIIRTSDIAAHSIIESRRAKGEDLPDYDKVMELGPVIIEGNEEYGKAIQAVWNKGGNAALTCYDLIRKDPRFKSLYNPEAPAKAAEKPKEEKPKETPAEKGKETLKKIDENSKKVKTSGAHGGGGEAQGDYGEYSFDQLLNMSTSEFRKVPKKIREKFLKDVG